MKNFAISDLERFSGIKAHTLRIWEHRYGIPKPARNKSNSRFYSVSELKHVLDISLLNRNGYRISALSKMSVAAIESKLQLLTADEDRQQMAIHDLLVSMYTLNTEQFESVLQKGLQTWSISGVVNEIICPFLKKTGLLWKGNGLTEEHFVVTAIRKKLMLAIEKAQATELKEKTVLLFLTDTRQLDLGLLCTNFLLKAQGIKVLYMGNDISVSNLKMVFESVKPHYLYTYLSKKNNFQFQELTSLMKDSLPGSKLIVTTHADSIPAHKSENMIHLSYDGALAELLG